MARYCTILQGVALNPTNPGSGGFVQAIDILYSERRSLAAVLHGMLYLVREIRLRGTAPRFDVLRAMVRYIDAFPERFHHPKEDAYLFSSSRCDVRMSHR
jgi:hemerythrin-like domain-containing protein